MRACFQFTLSPVAIIRVKKKKTGYCSSFTYVRLKMSMLQMYPVKWLTVCSSLLINGHGYMSGCPKA